MVFHLKKGNVCLNVREGANQIRETLALLVDAIGKRRPMVTGTSATIIGGGAGRI
jgi:hypothetical protein